MRAGYEKIPIWLHVRHQLNKLCTDFIVILNAAASSLALPCLSDHGSADGWHATSTWWPCLVANTAQQIRPHAVLLFWLKTYLRSDLRALNCEKFSRGKCSQTPLDPTWLHTHSSFSPPNLKYLLPPLVEGEHWNVTRVFIHLHISTGTSEEQTPQGMHESKIHFQCRAHKNGPALMHLWLLS